MHRQLLALLSFLIIAPMTAFGADDAGVNFFEQKIRPILVEHCYRCHSADAKRLRGELRLDTREGLRRGGESGPAIVPGKAGESLLIKALRYEKLEMPPKGKLPPRVIADFETWINSGAADPRTASATKIAAKAIDYRAALKHWAYQPIRRPPLPAVKNASWTKSPIDRFILSRLEEKILSPAAPADRRTLIRRAFFDLIGLPPTFAEVEAFRRDARPDAFARVVDRLLASPHYGERWGRHWLDVARYADTKDLVLQFGKDRIRPYAYTYRDYVVRAFNEDVPYDQFVREQIAADQIEPKVKPWKMAAMGFLTLGRLFDNNLPDIHDDQIDTVTRGFLGLTVSCARCHDHKYDAIPQADYYSLYGIFAGSERPLERPLIAQPERTPEYLAFEKRMNAKRAELRNHIDSQHREVTELLRSQVAEYLLHISVEKADPLETSVFFLSLSPKDLRPEIVINWRRFIKQRAHSDDPVFGPWHDLMQLSDGDIVSQTADIIKQWQAKPTGTSRGHINPVVRKALQSAPLKNRADVARRYGALLKQTYAASNKSGDVNKAQQQILEILVGPQSPTFFPKNQTYLFMSRVPRGRYSGLLQQMDRIAVDSPAAPPRAMSLVDSPQPCEPCIFVRGNPRRPGPKVPRQFLHVLSGGKPMPFRHGSGRLELAQAITHPDNPLTSRVMVNRIWQHHFGMPLVDTPNDFGVRSSPPLHPRLLDWLAWQFKEDGWSIKKLHRRIMMSSVYQQSSAYRDDCYKIDPENRLLWKFHRRPLDLEAMRDGMLYVAGRLDRRLGGRPVNVAGDAKNCRRTIYGLVDRQDLPNLYRVFNFANPDQSTARRPQTTVPQQGLFALNSPFVIEQAKGLAARSGSKDIGAAMRVRNLYRLALQRDPTPGEIEMALRFVGAAEAQNAGRLSPWEQFAQMLLVCNEAMFVE